MSKDINGNIEKYVEGIFFYLINYKKFKIGEKFMDGSISADIPMNKVAEFFNVNCFLVS
jgi:predicted acylesterase/phospholipase RssA